MSCAPTTIVVHGIDCHTVKMCGLFLLEPGGAGEFQRFERFLFFLKLMIVV